MDYHPPYRLARPCRIVCVLLCALLPLACEKPFEGEEEERADQVETPGGQERGDSTATVPGDADDDEGNTEETDIVDGDDESSHRDYTYTVTEFLQTQLGQRPVMVEGYIVGACTKSIRYAEWKPPFTHPQALLLADRKGETDARKVMSVKLKSGTMRDTFSLVSHPENLGKRAYFYGTKTQYLGIGGMGDYIGGYGWVE